MIGKGVENFVLILVKLQCLVLVIVKKISVLKSFLKVKISVVKSIKKRLKLVLEIEEIFFEFDDEFEVSEVFEVGVKFEEDEDIDRVIVV